MRKLDRQLIGILLVIGVILFAAGFEWIGPGLIVTDHPPSPPPVTTAQGVAITVIEGRTSYHLLLIPLVVLGLLSFVLALIPKRDEHADGRTGSS